MEEDTIIALSTPPGPGGLGIIRLSGPSAYSIVWKMFEPKNKKYKKIPSRQPILGEILDWDKKEPFEEAIVTYFPKPHSYTKEDVIEISCHGSPVILEEILKLGIKGGARLARPGEFTLRAYLNGRIDLIQAEAVNDLISASTLKQAKLSFSQLEGRLSKKIYKIREKIINLISRVEAAIEFPEENLGVDQSLTENQIDEILKLLQPVIDSYNYGRMLKEGTTVVITGKPNVGKSSLFNVLLQQERAIVTPYPGTTRDFLQEKVKIRDMSFLFIDTAGIGDSIHPVEVEGIKRGRKLIEEAEGILLMFDLSEKETKEDFELINQLRNKKIIYVFNKMDLPSKIDKKRILKCINNHPWLEISAKEEINLDKLKELIFQTFIPQEKERDEIITNLRQKIMLDKMVEHLKEAKDLLKKGYSEEFFLEETRKAADYIGQLTGEIKIDEILDEIFNNFCIGK
ncbi:MAG: tRNA uridine-5-carboxymethylaminomethyl(34) synthesis GTPase MnmE [Candidatus Aminicenantia bacterium]